MMNIQNDLWNKIIKLTNAHAYMSGIDRSKERQSKNTEVFTPTDIVVSMMKDMLQIDANCFAPGKTILDPACGDGQLLVPIKWYKVLVHQMSEEEAVEDLYGVDIMQDNIDICRKRLGGGNLFCDDMLEPQTKELKQLLGINESSLDDFFV